MPVTQRLHRSWARFHDRPDSPLFRTVKIYYPTSLQDLIEICKSRPAGERLKAAGSHWALSTAAVSDTAFIETNDPKGKFPAMDKTRYDIIPKCLDPEIREELKITHPPSFDQLHEDENGGTYFIHFETGKRVYQLYSELDQGDTANPDSLASVLIRDDHNVDYAGPWAFPTLGGAGGQTVFGALHTGTHGGDFRQPPICDAVVALHLVADGGKHYWIEADSIPEFERPLTDMAEVQKVYGAPEFGGPDNFRFFRNTDVFNAALVSAGRFGVVFSVVMRAVRQYCLHEERRLTDWRTIKDSIVNPGSDLYTKPEGTPDGKQGANKFLQVVVSLTPYNFFSNNLAAVTKRWNVAAAPDAVNPSGRAERAGKNAGHSISYTPDLDNPGKALPISFLERACSSGDLMVGVLETVMLEIQEFLEDNTVEVGGVIAAVGAIAGTAGLFSFGAAFLAFLEALKIFRKALQSDGNTRLGQTVDDVRSLLLDHDDPGVRAAGVFIWQCIYYKLFKGQQGDSDYEAISYAVMDQHNYIDKSCNLNADSIEVFFDARDKSLVAYIDALIAFEAGQEFQGKSFSGYASLRFMGASRALLGMQRWPMTCAIEVAGLRDVKGTTELIDYAISLALDNNFRGILHWGQRNPSTVQNIEDRFGAKAPVRPGELEKWRDVLKIFTDDGRLTGFSSPFTRQTGLEI
jgi:hypothetical protein